MRDELRPLPALNGNYDPPRKWVCVTHEFHECDGLVVGALGAVPVCALGEVVERAERQRQRARREAMLLDPAVQESMRWELAMERKYS